MLFSEFTQMLYDFHEIKHTLTSNWQIPWNKEEETSQINISLSNVSGDLEIF